MKLSEYITRTIRLVEWTDAGMRADSEENDRGRRETESVATPGTKKKKPTEVSVTVAHGKTHTYTRC